MQRAGRGDAAGRRRVGEHGVDQVEHGGGGAERHVQRGVAEPGAYRLGPAAHDAAPVVERRRVGALERVDGLLAVAHREHRAAVVRGTLAGEELGGQRAGDLPLGRRGVLHLIQKQVVQPAIQLEQHPGGAGVQQQLARAPDQVVVVQQPGERLALAEPLQHGAGERQQRVGHVHDAGGPAVVLQGGDALGLGDAEQRVILVLLAPCVVAEGGRRARLQLGGQHAADPLVPVLDPQVRRQVEPAPQRRRLLSHRLAAVRLRLLQRRRQRRLVRHGHRGGDQGGLVARHLRRASQPHPAQLRSQPQQRRQAVLLGVQPGDQLAVLLIGHQTGQGGECCRIGAVERLGPGRFQLGPAVHVLQQPEMRGERRFQRKPAQQGLAEGVDGADAHPAGQVQHAGEQRAGGGGACRRNVERLELSLKRRVVHRDPGAQHLLQPDRHFRRGRLGERQAQDALGIGGRVGQHQAQQPVDQQLGFARSGGRRDEGGNRRVRRLHLQGGGAGGGGGSGGVHSVSPSASAAHSATRANWV